MRLLRRSVSAVVANPRAMVAIGGGQRTARPTNRNAVEAFSPALARWWPCASTGICRPDGAGEWGGAGGYKDFAPHGAFGRSATVSAGPVAADGGAEAVENILRRGFANVLRLIPLGAGHSRAPTATRLQPSAQRWSGATTLGERAK